MTANTFFTSDHHFGHHNIIEYCNRPFVDTNHMNSELVRRWNERVMTGDTVYYLGDFSLASHLVAPFATRLNGTKHLIMGNHDACHPCHKAAVMSRGIYRRAGFQTLEMEHILTIAGQPVLLHHMPYLEESPQPGHTPKHAQYRPRDQGGWLVHGHVHDKWQRKDRMINIGVDVWDFYPVPLEEIEKIIAAPGSA